MAIGVCIAYIAVFAGLSKLSGVSGDDRFATSSNVLLGAVMPLAATCLMLVLFLVWARWDFVWKDPARLPMRPVLWIAVVVYALAIVTQFAVAGWSQATDRLLPIVLAAALVGFAEETMYRGIVLRSLRTHARPEAWVVLITSVWFGLFHMIGLFGGLNVISALIQSFLAAASGVVYYLYRRLSGALVVAMLAHGLWDCSLFLPQPTGSLIQANRLALILVVITSLIALIVIIVRERRVVVTRTGIETSQAV